MPLSRKVAALRETHSMTIRISSLSAMLEDVWPDEAAAVGSQYLGLIARAAVEGNMKPEEMFLRSEGDHAYGIAEAITTLTSAAALIVNCLQLRHSIKAQKEMRAKLVEEIRKEVEDEEKVQRLAD